MAIERLNTSQTDDRLQAALHRARYDFALERVPADARVLEIGTGAGCMTAELVAKCHAYTGLDADAEAIALTRDRLAVPARLVQGDAKRLPFGDGEFTHIVCLEVLEHLGDWRAGVAEIHRCLALGGKAVVSVPYRRRGGPNPGNRFHIYEPGEEELAAAFRERFEVVVLFSQFFRESWIEGFARRAHLRRLLGLDTVYRELSEGIPRATSRLEIARQANGMKINVLLVAERPRK